MDKIFSHVEASRLEWGSSTYKPGDSCPFSAEFMIFGVLQRIADTLDLIAGKLSFLDPDFVKTRREKEEEFRKYIEERKAKDTLSDAIIATLCKFCLDAKEKAAIKTLAWKYSRKNTTFDPACGNFSDLKLGPKTRERAEAVIKRSLDADAVENSKE